jgi:hypothetical protein
MYAVLYTIETRKGALLQRRQFLQTLTATTAGAMAISEAIADDQAIPSTTDGFTLVCEFKLESESWKVYEDLRSLEGPLLYISASGKKRLLSKSAEPCFPDAGPQHLGLDMAEVGSSGPDLLADRLLRSGDPQLEEVRSAAPPQGSAQGPANGRVSWNTFVGTKECFDTAPVFPAGNTRTYHPNQYLPELREPNLKRLEGMLGGWMPAVLKIFPLSDTAHIETIVFGDVEAKDKFIVQTWHRSTRIEKGKVDKVFYGYSYPAYPPAKLDPTPEEFYRALLVFAGYWEKQVADLAPCAMPESRWTNMTKYAFVKELMVRPGGVYPKYGAVDRDYYGSEYDGFQDIFTSALYTNLEWGRFDMARHVLDNYFTDFVDAKGGINMRGPETGQFGLTLTLLAKYLHYTGDRALLLKHRAKIEATAGILIAMHEESLRLPKDKPGYGLIAGWSESDACLAPEPATWWQPYFANSAFAARGLTDIAIAWEALGRPAPAAQWRKHAAMLREATVASIDKNIHRDSKPPYIGPLPGAKLTFRESMAQERPSPQQWPHRPYAELLQADVLPAEQANLVIDCMRAYGATTFGIVANVGRVRPGARDILGFISYGYAQMLLRLDRVEEYLLFLYAHAYHDHTRGSWTAGEVSGINGGTAIFCIPAQQTIPMLVRWMLVLEDSEADRLYLAKGTPREWLAGNREIRIDAAPTRWGKVNFRMAADQAAKKVTATVELAREHSPKELHVKIRLPENHGLGSVLVNGRPATIGGQHKDTVIIETKNTKRFEVTGQFS